MICTLLILAGKKHSLTHRLAVVTLLFATTLGMSCSQTTQPIIVEDENISEPEVVESTTVVEDKPENPQEQDLEVKPVDDTRNRISQLELRLVEAQRQLYRATPGDARSELLQVMLSDDVDAMRLLAMTLAEERLVVAATFDKPLREAILARMDDSLPEMRRRAALLLRDLDDQSAADAIATRLADGRETDPQVISAYLRVMARWPRVQVVDRELELLADKQLSGQAAGALVAAWQARMLTPAQAQMAAQRVRAQIRKSKLPQPEHIALLGWVGNEKDWKRIESWMDAEDVAVKQAAAGAWAASSRPLASLAARSGDPIIGPLAIEAATRRGNHVEVMLALMVHEPQQEQQAAAWRRALLSMAWRVQPRDLVVDGVDDLLAGRDDLVDLRGKVLSAGIDRLSPESGNGPTGNGDNGLSTQDPYPVAVEYETVVLGELLLRRMELRLNRRDYESALADCDRIMAIREELSEEQLWKYEIGRLQGLVYLGRYDQALPWAETVYEHIAQHGDAGIRANKITELLIKTARDRIKAGEYEQAMTLLEGLKKWAGLKQVEGLEQSVKQMAGEVEMAMKAKPTQQEQGGQGEAGGGTDETMQIKQGIVE